MPELPEVQTFIKQIKPLITNNKIKSLTVTEDGLRLINPSIPEDFQKQIEGKVIKDIKRHGKFIIFDLDDQSKIVAHLRMSGRFVITDKPFVHKHNRLFIEFEEGNCFNFIDIRRFATFHYVGQNSHYKSLAGLGPDALSDSFNTNYLYKKLKNKSKNIYSSIMDQSVVAGIGNIYANEILFRSELNPTVASNNVQKSKLSQLVSNTKEVLEVAIAHKGTTLIDKSYKDMHGGYGNYNYKLKVYAKDNEPCTICNNPIEKLKINGRSVYYCPICQK